MRPCLQEEELFALVDGALAEKDARLLRDHAKACDACTKSIATLDRALSCLADEEALDVAAHADAVLAALDRPLPVPRPRGWQRPAVTLGIGAMAAAAAFVLGIDFGRHSEEGFAARGPSSAEHGIRRSVAIDVQTLEADVARPLVPGATVSASTRFVASHRNTGSTTAYAMVFGVDAHGVVHWLYPAYESAGTDPASVPLPPTRGRDVSMGTGVSFDDMSPGRLSVISLLSRAPLRLSTIEARAALGIEALRRDFPDADVTSIDVQVSLR